MTLILTDSLSVVLAKSERICRWQVGLAGYHEVLRFQNEQDSCPGPIRMKRP